MVMQARYYDDKTEFSRELGRQIKSGARHVKQLEIESIEPEALVTWMNGLLSKEVTQAGRELQKKLDSTDLLFLDADLRGTAGLPFLTGERVAYFVRCYTTCRAIILVNPTPRPTFDLRLCSVTNSSWADVWIHVEDLSNSWLWSEKHRGFAPWYWPNVAEIPGNVRKRLRGLSLDMSLRELLKIPPEVEKRLPKDRFNALIGNLDDSLRTIAERRIDEDDLVNDAAKTRIAAFTIAGWLENRLLPAQSILVDAPHACTLFPGLAGRKPNDACSRRLQRFPGLRKDIRHARFSADAWLSRSAWWLARLENDDDILALEDDFLGGKVFAEDDSSFVPRKREDVDVFTIALATPFLQRYVIHFRADGHHEYEPAVRLLEA